MANANLPTIEAKCGPYRLVRCIGSGATSSVFEAEDPDLGRRVAIKCLHPHVAGQPNAIARFVREGRAAARVHHPHVVGIHGFGWDGQKPYLVMELLDGEDLSGLLAKRGRLDLIEALEVLLPVVAGVAAAHDSRVVHRDLKPSNILVGRSPAGGPYPKVVDFGTSKILDTEFGSLVTSGLLGTLAYMSPEQAQAACEVSSQSDQYALGVILYQCVTGHLPFGGGTACRTLRSIMSAPVIPPTKLRADLSPALDEVVLRAMSRVPQDRYADVRALGQALNPFASESCRAAWRELNGARTTVTVGAEAPSSAAGSLLRTEPGTERQRVRPPSRVEGVALGEIGPVCVAVWSGAVTYLPFQAQSAALADVVAHYPGRAGFLCVVEPSATPPEERLRRASVDMVADHGERLRCVACVIEGEGFKAAVARSVLSGMLILRPAPQLRVRFFSTVRAAALWMRACVNIDSAAAFASSVEEIRRAPGTPPFSSRPHGGPETTLAGTACGDDGAYESPRCGN